jgi:hypothetical protein
MEKGGRFKHRWDLPDENNEEEIAGSHYTSGDGFSVDIEWL